jgi:60S ribosome biogenesis protein Rrp14
MSYSCLSLNVRDHNDFFVRIITLIPSDLYAERGIKDEDGEDDDADDVAVVNVNSKYFKHRKQPLSADDRKLMSKQAKREKYKSLGMSQQSATQTEVDVEDESDKYSEENGKEAYSNHALDTLRERLQVSVDSVLIDSIAIANMGWIAKNSRSPEKSIKSENFWKQNIRFRHERCQC